MSQVRLVVGALEEFTERLMTQLSVNATANLVEDTPVDTGWARANWVPSISVEFEGDAIEFDTAEQRSAATPGRRAEQQSGIASLTGYRLERGPIFITNNVPYIVILNEGSSAQAPAAFVQSGIQRAVMSLGG